MTSFFARLRTAAETLNVIGRQCIVRLLVKEVLIGDDMITIRHSIPILSGPPAHCDSPHSPSGDQSLLLCKGRDHTPCGTPCLPSAHSPELEVFGSRARSNYRCDPQRDPDQAERAIQRNWEQGVARLEQVMATFGERGHWAASSRSGSRSNRL